MRINTAIMAAVTGVALACLPIGTATANPSSSDIQAIEAGTMYYDSSAPVAGGCCLGGPTEVHTGVVSHVPGEEYNYEPTNVWVLFNCSYLDASSCEVVYSEGQTDGTTSDIRHVGATTTPDGTIVLTVTLAKAAQLVQHEGGRSLVGVAAEQRITKVVTHPGGATTVTFHVPPNRHPDYFTVEADDPALPVPPTCDPACG